MKNSKHWSLIYVQLALNLIGKSAYSTLYYLFKHYMMKIYTNFIKKLQIKYMIGCKSNQLWNQNNIEE